MPLRITDLAIDFAQAFVKGKVLLRNVAETKLTGEIALALNLC
jgi:hypothetical protein